MSHGMKAVSKNRVCPICGHADWCGFFPIEDIAGGELVICMRDTGKANVEGYDGNSYVYVSDSRSGNSVYEELTQYNTRHPNRKNQKRQMKPVPKKEPKEKVRETVIEPRSDSDCALIYQELVSLLKLEVRHREYLHTQGWSDEMIEKYHIVSFPVDDRLYEKYRYQLRFCNPSREELAVRIIAKYGEDALLGIPGAYKNQGRWTFASPSGILFPMYSMDGNMFRLRIRRDFMDVTSREIFALNPEDFAVSRRRPAKDRIPYFCDESGDRIYLSMKGCYRLEEGEKVFLKTGGKYRTLASYYPDPEAEKFGIIRNKYDSGCQAKNALSFYFNPGDEPSMWYFTEGEPKGLFANEKIGSPVVTIPGVNSYALALEPEVLQMMTDNGMEMACIVFDADKSHNDKVLDCERKLSQGFLDAGIPVVIGEWDESVGKGIDDLLSAGGAICYRVFTDDVE